MINEEKAEKRYDQAEHGCFCRTAGPTFYHQREIHSERCRLKGAKFSQGGRPNVYFATACYTLNTVSITLFQTYITI